MNYSIEKHSNYYLDDTQVPNIFISEYMPGAPGDYVKVYLYAYMRAVNRDVTSNETIALELAVGIEDVLAAWTYFEKRGLIRKNFYDPSDELRYDVEFTDIKGLVVAGAGHTEDGGEKLRSALDDEDVRDMFVDIERLTGKPLAGADISRVGALLDEGIPPELVVFAYKYCGERKKNVRAPYVAEVVRSWLTAGVRTAKDAESYVWAVDARMDVYKRIMKSLGLHFASITDAEKRVFDTWLDDMGFTVEEILTASEKTAGKRNKYDYVKKILESEHEAMSTGGLNSVPGARRANARPGRDVYYIEARAKAEAESDARRREVYGKLAVVERIDKELARLNRESVSAIMSRTDGGRKESSRIAAEIEKKLAEKAGIMSNAGYSPEYMDIRYHCAKCRDTGTLDDGGACDCFIPG